jgi:hypothetical protein
MASSNMPLNFNFYHASDTAPIYSRDLKAYAADSKRSLRDRNRRKYAWLKTIRNTVTQFTPLLALSLLASHGVYA